MTNLHTLYICTTCKKRMGDEVVNPEAGLELFRSICTQQTPSEFRIEPVECLSACKKACAIALTAPGKYSYILAHLDTSHVEDILALAETYREKGDGVIKKIDRPESLRDKVQGRIPPLSKDI